MPVHGGSNVVYDDPLHHATAYVGFDASKQRFTNYFLCVRAQADIAIQAAIDYVNAQGGGEVFLEGVATSVNPYIITATITYYTRITIKGINIGATVLALGNGVNGNMFEYAGATAIQWNVFQDLWLSGNKANNTSGSGIYSAPAGAELTMDFDILRVFVSSFKEYGVHLANSWGFRSRDLICEFNELDGLFLDIAGSHASLAQCKFNSNVRHGANIQISRAVLVECEFAINGERGIWLGAGTEHIINSCFIRDNGQAAANTHDGIFIGSGDRQIITDNLIDGVNQQRYGINIAAAARTGVLVRDNQIINNVSGAINDNGTDTKLPEVQGVVDPGLATTTIGDGWGIPLPDAADTHVRINFNLLPDFQELVRCRVLVIPGGTGNLAYTVATDFGHRCTEVYTTHSDAKPLGVQAVTLNEIECIAVDVALDDLGGGDFVLMDFMRDGDDASDTVGAACVLVGAYLQYV